MTIAHLVDPTAYQRRMDAMAREQLIHLVCPICEWIVQPVEGLAIDRLRRLVGHIGETHPFEWRLFTFAIAAEDPFYGLGDPE